MFLDIDKHNPASIAAIDDNGFDITYGNLVNEITAFNPKISKRSIAFILSENCIASLVAYLSMIERDVVPLILNRKTEKGLLIDMVNVYKPKYIYLRMEDAKNFTFTPVYNNRNYVLLETHNDIYPINEKLQFLMTTSGSTGSPKLVRYKRGNLEANARNVAKAFEWNCDERAICDLGMQYTMGLNVINTHLYVGGTVLLTSRNIISSEFWDFVKKNNGTNFTGVPFSYDILHRLHYEKMNEINSIKTFSQGGGKLTEERFKEFSEYCNRTGRRFIASFGTTETSARMCMLDPKLATEKIGSVGRAIPEGEVFLIDMDNNIIDEPNVEGELCYKGPNVTMGYAECIDDLNKGDEWNGEYHTGDLSVKDIDDCYYITGRKNRFLKLLGHRVGLDECERMISERFNCSCACMGDDQKMRIFIDGNITTELLKEYISKKLCLYKNLFDINRLNSIPRNESGKIDYKTLEEKI